MSISNIIKAIAAMKVMLTAKNEWQLSDDELYCLLGKPDPILYSQYLQNQFAHVSEDLLIRLASLTIVYGQLKSLYSPENQILWLKNTSHDSSEWQGKSPLAVMCESLAGIHQVLHHLNALQG